MHRNRLNKYNILISRLILVQPASDWTLHAPAQFNKSAPGTFFRQRDRPDRIRRRPNDGILRWELVPSNRTIGV